MRLSIERIMAIANFMYSTKEEGSDEAEVQFFLEDLFCAPYLKEYTPTDMIEAILEWEEKE